MSPVHSPTRALPGWRLVLDAFLDSPDRVLTNAQLGQIRGVQAWHQRLSDLRRMGYLITDAVQLRPGRYAYDLIGVKEARASALARSEDLAQLAPGDVVAAEQRAHEYIVEQTEKLLKRADLPKRPATPGPTANHNEALRQQAATAAGLLADALGAGDDDLVQLATDAATRLKSTPTIGQSNGEMYLGLVQRLRDALDEAGVESAQGLNGPEVIDATLARVKKAPKRAPRQPRDLRSLTGPQLMRKALEFHGDPMHSSAIAEWVLANGGTDVYHGKTPAATMAAQLATSNKTGGEFEKVAPGCYALREWDDEQKAMDPVRVAAGGAS